MRESHTIQAGWRGKRREPITLVIRGRYRVVPLNPQKKKHRDRVSTILEFDDHFMPSFANVQFEDNNRKGKVDLADLQLVD